MNSWKIKVATSLFAIAGVSAHAERWSITEGISGEWRGDWVIEAGRADFPCSQRSGPHVIVANCTIIRQGNLVAFSKADASDGNPCNYFGTVDNKSASGVYFCHNAGPYYWRAVISG